MEELKIGLAGYGKLARHLVPELQRVGVIINQWYVRDIKVHDEIRSEYNTQPFDDIGQLSDDNDIILLLVSDSAIREVSSALKVEQTVVCHTSGMTGLDAISQPGRGKFYPLNTFNGIDTSWNRETPLLISASDTKTEAILTGLGNMISGHVKTLDANSFKYVHLAAVIAQNFSNFLIAKGEQIVLDHDLDRELLHPLLATMISNLKRTAASSNQTGPAVRNDTTTLNNQINMLESTPYWKDVYELLTRGIQNEVFK